MSLHQQNLLQAFRNAGGTEAPAAPSLSVTRAGSGSSFARGLSAFAFLPVALRGSFRWWIGIALAFLIGVYVGRPGADGEGQGSTVEAAGLSASAPGESASASGSGSSPALTSAGTATRSPGARSSVDVGAGETVSPRGSGITGPATRPGTERPVGSSAFFDPANQHTVVAITYRNSKAHEGLAWTTHDHLQKQGFAVTPPLLKGGYIFVVVDAAPEKQSLFSVRDRLRTTSGPTGAAAPYGTAYIEYIANLQ